MIKEDINKLARNLLTNDKTGHDFNHITRVLNLSKRIAKNYPQVNLEDLEIACLLHDISYKDGPVKNHHLVSAEIAGDILKERKYPEEKIQKIKEIIRDHVGHMVESQRDEKKLPLESKILRDADNLDALGSIGLIRMISFSLNQNIPYFNSVEDGLDESFYGNVKFLLDWPEKMLTKEGREIGNERVRILKEFLSNLEKEHH